MFSLIYKEKIKKVKFHSNFQQVSYLIKSITLKNFKYSLFFNKKNHGLEIFFLNVVQGLIDSVWENHLLHKNE